MGKAIPQTCNDFNVSVRTVINPFDYLRRTRDKVLKMVEYSSVAKYSNETCNLVDTTTYMNDGEKRY